MRNAAWREFISSWQQSILTWPRTDQPLKSRLPHWHDKPSTDFPGSNTTE